MNRRTSDGMRLGDRFSQLRVHVKDEEEEEEDNKRNEIRSTSSFITLSPTAEEQRNAKKSVRSRRDESKMDTPTRSRPPRIGATPTLSASPKRRPLKRTVSPMGLKLYDRSFSSSDDDDDDDGVRSLLRSRKREKNEYKDRMLRRSNRSIQNSSSIRSTSSDFTAPLSPSSSFKRRRPAPLRVTRTPERTRRKRGAVNQGDEKERKGSARKKSCSSSIDLSASGTFDGHNWKVRPSGIVSTPARYKKIHARSARNRSKSMIGGSLAVKINEERRKEQGMKCEFITLSELGRGNSGLVFKAVHVPTLHVVAIKRVCLSLSLSLFLSFCVCHLLAPLTWNDTIKTSLNETHRQECSDVNVMKLCRSYNRFTQT